MGCLFFWITDIGVCFSVWDSEIPSLVTSQLQKVHPGIRPVEVRIRSGSGLPLQLETQLRSAGACCMQGSRRGGDFVRTHASLWAATSGVHGQEATLLGLRGGKRAARPSGLHLPVHRRSLGVVRGPCFEVQVPPVDSAVGLRYDVLYQIVGHDTLGLQEVTMRLRARLGQEFSSVAPPVQVPGGEPDGPELAALGSSQQQPVLACAG